MRKYPLKMFRLWLFGDFSLVSYCGILQAFTFDRRDDEIKLYLDSYNGTISLAKFRE